MENSAFNTVVELIKTLHRPETFATWLSVGGIWVVTGIIFAETGLLFGFFLPGDSLLITTGVLCNPMNPSHVDGLSLIEFQVVLAVAAIVGDQLGYFLGSRLGHWVSARPDSFFFKKKHLADAHAFYEKYGIASIIACRFVPIMRTFVPFVAGMARMNYRKYLSWDIFGGLLWTQSLLLVGYYLGQTELANRLDKVIVIVIIVSTIPMLIGIAKKMLQKKPAGSQT
ncbi:MAG: DedA family protein [Bdellovibrionales bacterium]|nr:DedA family protein [Bdellovibrionales bacterium]